MTGLRFAQSSAKLKAAGAGLAASSGAVSDYVCQGKSASETLKGVPGNIAGAVVGDRLGKRGMGDLRQTIGSEITKEVTNRGINQAGKLGTPNKKR
ncbi:hypothetical protein [Neisseria sp. HMSC064E01]|jgi:hypothetical protein|uniref:hypothetical protein n=1 Tax=Neisseria sp. HMSC064E01 TaxID=1715052 RepID=UPI0008A2D121|nr:hypothetical protein [Neisseria sp. HMSC064E01]OFN89704.1 hypothetical protein HMPREF2572_10650 [Neisseria sp. HMSC064E01]